MTLPVPDLDDRRFQDLVDEAKRLIAVHCPEWTNHNVSDPGIALIELFAYMTEQTLFRLNRVPDRLYTVFLNMVGITPYPARPARAHLTFGVSMQASEVVIPASTEVGTRTEAGGQTIFVTDRELVLHQPRLIAALSSTAGATGPSMYKDRWDDARFQQRSVPCFENMEPGDAFYLGFEQSLADHVIRLSVGATAMGLGINPGEPPLAWEVSTDEGWALVDVHADGTGGLNRDGVIDVAFPPRHDRMVLADTDAWWLRVVLLPERRGRKSYGASPEITSLAAVTIGGQVEAHHGEPVGAEVLATSDGTPGQRYRLQRAPTLPPDDHEVVRVVSGNGSEEWTPVEHFGDSTETDRHYLWHEATGEIEFGPEVRDAAGVRSQRGAVPSRGAQIAVTGYRVGGGEHGNVGSATLRVLRTTVPYVERVTNRQAAAGGVDAETVEEAKIRAPLTLRTGRRAVTASDFARLAREATGEVARSRCLENRNGDRNVRLLIVPDVRIPLAEQTIDDYAIDDALFDRLHDHLDQRRLVGTTVEIGTPFYQGVSIVVQVTAPEGVDRRALETRLLDALYQLTSPIVGGPSGTGVPFGWTLTSDVVRQSLAAVAGVGTIDNVLLFSADLRGERRLGAAEESIELGQDSLFLGFRHRAVIA